MRSRSLSALFVLFFYIATAQPVFAGDYDRFQYDRSEWLPRWSDFDGDCQNTRHELLIRYSLAPVTFKKSRECSVASGLWMDPYTGNFYQKSTDLDVEHIVPLKWAHEHGGAHWSREQKRRFAEDPDNLWLVDKGRNRSKGDKGPDEWMPPYGPVSRIYVQRFMALVEKYGLQPSLVEVSSFERLASGS